MKNRIKVLLVSPYSSKKTGGIGTWSKIVLDYCKTDNSINLCFLNTVSNLPKRKALSNSFTHLIIGGIDSLKILFLLFWRLLFSQPDVVHYTSSAASALYKDILAIQLVKSIFHKKFVIHWHFGRIPLIFEEKGKEYSLFTKVCKKADLSITIDKRSYNTLIREGITAVEIPNPIPSALQVEAQSLNNELLHMERKRGEVLFVGHVLKSKGIYELVQACTNCESVLHLIIVGPVFENSVKDDLRKIASKRDNGRWLDLVGEKNREEVWNYYKNCSVFCLPSYSEGFPYVLLEAMAFGCPIIATKVGAIPDILSESCGVQIEAQQIEPLMESLDDLLINKDKAYTMGRLAHERVLANYSIEKVFIMYKNAWTNIMAYEH